MSRYFAERNASGTVLRVVVCEDGQWAADRLGGEWVETKMNDPNVPYTGKGIKYDAYGQARFTPGASSSPKNLVFEGDSITAGWGVSKGFAKVYPSRANMAVSGSTITGASQSLMSRVAALDALIVPGAQNVLVVMTGNDMYYGADAATECSRLAAYLGARKVAGWQTRVVLSTLPRSVAQAPGFNAKRATANATKATWVGTHCEAFIDLSASSIGRDADAESAAKYLDGVHPNDASHAVLLGIIGPALDAIQWPPVIAAKG